MVPGVLSFPLLRGCVWGEEILDHPLERPSQCSPGLFLLVPLLNFSLEHYPSFPVGRSYWVEMQLPDLGQEAYSIETLISPPFKQFLDYFLRIDSQKWNYWVKR